MGARLRTNESCHGASPARLALSLRHERSGGPRRRSRHRRKGANTDGRRPSRRQRRRLMECDTADNAERNADASGGKKRVFLVDDHEVVRRGVADMLESTGEFVVVGEAGTVTQALDRLQGLEVDVAVLDVRLPDGNGIELCREIRSLYPQIGCLMLTSFSHDDALVDAAMAGAHGYALKQIRGTEIIDAVRTVAAGQSTLDPATTRRA